jgi:PAS domain S-box-containing protein
MRRTSIFDLVHPDDAASTLGALEHLRGDNALLKFENRYRRRDGTYRWLSWVAVPEGGRFYCSARDVTADKERAEELTHRTAERDRVWRLSQDLLVIAEADGTLAAVNASWTTLLGWSEAELVGRTFVEFTHPDDVAPTLTVFAAIFDSPLSKPYEYRLRHRDGTYRWFAWTAAFEDGRVYASGRHTTAEHEAAAELAEAQAQLRQAQKMEAIGQLTGGLAHDVNNMLQGIAGALQLMEKRIEGGRLAELPRLFQAAQDGVNRAAGLTRGLLAFARRGQLNAKPVVVTRLSRAWPTSCGVPLGRGSR